jgi:hypothetical protein
MKRLKLFLFGKHRNRTPFAYSTYRPHLAEWFDLTVDASEADLIVTGYANDFISEQKYLLELLDSNSKARLCCISEEPLWDSLWLRWNERVSGAIYNIPILGSNSNIFQCILASHFNSSIFDFRYIPYFLTTDAKYMLRYISFGNSILSLSKAERKSLLLKSPFVARGFFEHRNSSSFETADIGVPLSVKRTQIGESLLRKCSESKMIASIYMRSVEINGKGWKGSESRRQDLSDWHLNKMCCLSAGHASMVFAIENTVAPYYITEKIFDAIFSYSIPIHMLTFEQSKKLSILCGNWQGLRLLPAESPIEICDQIISFRDNLDLYIDRLDFLLYHCHKVITAAPFKILEYEIAKRSKAIYTLISDHMDQLPPARLD